MNPEISILIASLREEELKKRLKEYNNLDIKTDYEIIVVSPFEVIHPKVKWIKEEEIRGNVYAMEQAYQNSRGNYIMYFADDISPVEGSIDLMYKFIKDKTEPFLGAFKMIGLDYNEQQPWGINGKLYACYGAISRKSIELIGGFFDTSFKHSWCDPDLSLRVWEKGNVEKSLVAMVINNQITDNIHINNTKLYFDIDTKTFLHKWHKKLNIPLNTYWHSFNKELTCI